MSDGILPGKSTSVSAQIRQLPEPKAGERALELRLANGKVKVGDAKGHFGQRLVRKLLSPTSRIRISVEQSVHRKGQAQKKALVEALKNENPTQNMSGITLNERKITIASAKAYLSPPSTAEEIKSRLTSRAYRTDRGFLLHDMLKIDLAKLPAHELKKFAFDQQPNSDRAKHIAHQLFRSRVEIANHIPSPTNFETAKNKINAGAYYTAEGKLDQKQLFKDIQHLDLNELKKFVLYQTQLSIDDDEVHEITRKVYTSRKASKALQDFDPKQESVEELKNKLTKNYHPGGDLDQAMRSAIDAQLQQIKQPAQKSITKQSQGTEKPGGLTSIQVKAQSLFVNANRLPATLARELNDASIPGTTKSEYQSLNSPWLTVENNINHEKNQYNSLFNAVVPLKYRDMGCPMDSMVTRNYHASRVPLTHGNYIAAQGALKSNQGNFFQMLHAEDSPVSVSLISNTDIQRGKSIEPGPKKVGETESYTVKTFEDDGSITEENVRVKLIDSKTLQNGKVQIEQLEINGKPHFRVSYRGWIDKTDGKPAEITALALTTETLRKHPKVAHLKDKPVVVNCNAGVGRTGTFITCDNTLRGHLAKAKQVPFEEEINKARKNRPLFVQTAGQFNTLRKIHKHFDQILATLESPSPGAKPKATPAKERAGTRPPRPPKPTILTQDQQTPPPVPSRKEREESRNTLGENIYQQLINGEYNKLGAKAWDKIESDVQSITREYDLWQLEQKATEYAKTHPGWNATINELKHVIDEQRARMRTNP